MRVNRIFDKHLKNFDKRGPVRSHSFRASKATHMAEEGIQLQQIMRYLGHKSIETTQKYIKNNDLETNSIRKLFKEKCEEILEEKEQCI